MPKLKLKTWIGASAADVGVRLTAQMLSTIVMARVLMPEEFGLASLILGPTAILAAFVGMPFEESLTQRARLTTQHLEAALFASLALTVLLVALAAVAGPLVARLAGQPTLAYWLPVSALFLLGQGPGSISRAISRRRRHFVSIAVCQSSSTVIGCSVAVLVAFAGYGVFALILHRMLPIMLYPVLAALDGRAAVKPLWHREKFAEISHFSRLHLARVAIEYTNPTVLSFMVNAYFGTAVLGQLNIAMRITEPLRSGIAGAGHNLATSLLVQFRDDAAKLARATVDVIANVASLAVPAFFGLGVCAPILLPLVVGPGWSDAIPLARALCLAAAISVPFRYVYSGYLAGGRPEYGVLSATGGLVAMVVSVEILARLDDGQNVALPVAAGEATVAALGVIVLGRLGGATILEPLWRVVRIWAAGGLMVAVLSVVFLDGTLNRNDVPTLLAMIACGCLVYAAFLFVLCRPCFDALVRLVGVKRSVR